MSGTVCMPRDPTNPCTADWLCDGAGACIMHFAPATTVCGMTTSGVCDGPHLCEGTSATCVAHYASGIVCRPASGACDVIEVCSGTSPMCPPDGVLGAGVVCRAATASCDPVEDCDGTSTTCPSDVNLCPTMPDTGVVVPDTGSRDGGGLPHDASAGGTDAASTPPAAAGSCGCRAGGSAHGNVLVFLALALNLCWRRRRA